MSFPEIRPHRHVPAFHIQIATEAELEPAAVLFDAYRQFYEQPPDLARARRFMGERMKNGDSVVLLAWDGQRKALGFCQLYPTFCSLQAAPIYTLSDLFVLPEARRGGAASALLRAAQALAEKNGMVRMDLTTAKTNTSAQALYEALGWVRDEVFHAYSRRIGA